MENQIMQQKQLLIVDNKINEDFNFKIESPNQIISESEIYNHQTKTFLNNYELDDSWDSKQGAFGFVEKFILKNCIKETQSMPREVIRKTVIVRNEAEKFEIEREIQAYINLAKIKDRSENLVNFFGWKQENKFTFHIYIEFCGEGSLQDLMDKKKKGQIKFSEDEILSIFRQLLKALQYLQSINLAHRDLKPDNILFKNGIMKLTDFGKAKIGSKKNTLKPLETQTCTQVGTPLWHAPEITYLLETEQYVADYDIFAGDMYSFGLIISSLLRNEPIYNSIATLLGKSLKEASSTLAFDYDSKGKRFISDPPNKKINGPFDSIIENIIKQEIHLRNNNKSLEKLSLLLYQMLIFNPNSRINYTQLNRQAIVLELNSQKEYSLFEYQMIINAQPLVFNKVTEDIMLYKQKLTYYQNQLKKGGQNLQSSNEKKVFDDNDKIDQAIQTYYNSKQEEALKIFKNLQSEFSKNYGQNSEQVANCLAWIGKCYLSLCKYDLAAKNIDQSYSMRKMLHGQNHVITLKSYQIKSDYYERLGKYEEAKIMLEEILKIRIQTLGKNHIDTAETFSYLG